MLEKFAIIITKWSGTTSAFLCAFFIVFIWLLGAIVFNLWVSEMYNLAINTATTIITFLMVFLLQRGQNKESAAIQLKLNELLAASETASNRMIGIEHLTENQVRELSERFKKLAEKARNHNGGHSIEEIPKQDNSCLVWMIEDKELK